MALELGNTTTIATTLYDVIAALNDETEPHEEALVVQIVMEMLNAGRAKFAPGSWQYKVKSA